MNEARQKNKSIEPLGSKRKFWFTPVGQKPHLFKFNKEKTGEDWAEVVVAQLCDLLGLPHVNYTYSSFIENGINFFGSVCIDMRPNEQCRLVLGNELLLNVIPEYPLNVKNYKTSAHTVSTIHNVLKTLEPPTSDWTEKMPKGITNALSVFMGYLLLDAWVANQDRHHENWGAIQVVDKLHLAPSFDHGASLANILTDENREKRLKTQDKNYTIGEYVKKAKSALYSNENPHRTLLLMDAFDALAAFAPDAAKIWKNQLNSIALDSVRQIVFSQPNVRMSSVCKEFTFQLLALNQQRLLNTQ